MEGTCAENPLGHDLNEYYRAFGDFKDRYRSFESTHVLDAFRKTEFKRLDDKAHTYLDFAGGGLYAECQLREHQELLKKGVYGNPHSFNPSSQATTILIENARKYVLKYFNASPDEYVAIFTQNASNALKLLGESYPFSAGDRFLLTFDNHNSVNGIREFARRKGAHFAYTPSLPHNLRIDEGALTENLNRAVRGKNNLFAYPAQSNFSGVKHDLKWIETARDKGWDVLLDAAAFVPGSRLDLTEYHPDFVSISFYKIFGYPTGIGCLLARKAVLKKLMRPWFSGGTITVASVLGDRHYLAENEMGFEDGTVNYLDVPAVEIGLRFIEGIGIDLINERIRCLTGWLLEELSSLRHGNGSPLIRLYGPDDTTMRGGIITLNFLDSSGDVFHFKDVETSAGKENISLRTGCFCNPGANELAQGLIRSDLVSYFAGEKDMSFDKFISLMRLQGKTLGAVRISVGLITNFSDVFLFLKFARKFIDKNAH